MSPINKVALVGKGMLGSAVLGQLLKAGFDVTILSRSNKEDPTGAAVAQVDYSSIDSLTAALRGQDAVVSTVGSEGIASQKLIIDAAIIAGVRRFIPSNFGSVVTDPKAKDILLFQGMVQIADYLKEKASAGEIEYTLIAPGAFTEFCFGGPMFIDPQSRTAQFHGNGQVPVSSTSLGGIGKAVAGALLKADETKNRLLHIHQTVLTQAKMLQLAKKIQPEGAEWTQTTVDPLEALEAATKQFQENPADFGSVMGLIRSVVLSGKYYSGYTELDNDLVGLEMFSDEDLLRDWAPLLAKSQ
ncbi:hypothetical protein FZEAL_8261 [Fusarium zealandicum]|uniref:NmrA-like domain-containing protein n=1 Tax=Fusarium zealandicum TaxID=1053134 RepID=A0A8H4XHU9_9HYPO|nr:hypothetical protein FZEAL_8261 [Fusarium zealandicum]